MIADNNWAELPYFISTSKTGFSTTLLEKFDAELLLGQLSYKQKADIYNFYHKYERVVKKTSINHDDHLLKMTKLFPGNDCVKPCTLNWYSGLALYTIYVSVTTPPFMPYVKGHVLIADVLRKLISSIASSECTSGMTSTFLGGCYHVTSNSYWKKSPPHYFYEAFSAYYSCK